jgi:3-deoxy-manno-octulosonate cytidylyltransferase (CMP-KDO synthetase)
MSTLCTPIDKQEEFFNPNLVKVVMNNKGQAIYFSRSPIPMDRDDQFSISKIAYRHLGIYGFRMEYLKIFAALPMAKLEAIEKLEQLRALENGDPIEIAIAEKAPPPGVDTQEDLEAAIVFAKLQNK